MAKRNPIVEITELLHKLESFTPSRSIGTDEIIGHLVTSKGNDVKLRFVRRTNGWSVGVDVYIEVNDNWVTMYYNNGKATKALQDAWQVTKDRAFQFDHRLQDEQRAIASSLLQEALNND